MRDLLPQLPRRPAHLMHHSVDPGDVAPAARAALRAEQLLQSLVAQHQHRVGLDHQLGRFVGHAPGFELFRPQQVQEVLLAVAVDLLLRVGWAEQLSPAGSSVSAWGRRRRH